MDLHMKMPDLATTGSPITLVRWLVQRGEKIKRGQPLAEVETEKATSNLESIASGVVKELRVSAGAAVAVGQVIAVIQATRAEPLEGPPSPLTNAPGEFRAHIASRSPERISPVPDTSLAKGGTLDTVSAAVSQITPESYDREFLLSIFQRMVLIREFEERVKLLFLEGAMPGTIHQCHGQEACAVGVCAALNADDWITSTFRGHGHALAKGLTPQELLDELFGARTGCCKGKGGSMHVGNMEKSMVPGIAIVAGGIPLAAGMALALKMQKNGHVVACFFGDGAVAEGAFHEALNMAAVWNLPVIFVCENNLYGASTHISKVMKNTRISDRAASYGFRGETVDGNDVIAVLEATQQAAADCRAGTGPVLLELLTYRRTGHSRRDPCHYQPPDERAAWFSRDPLDRFAAQLVTRADIKPTDLERIKTQVRAEIEVAVEKAKHAPLPAPGEVSTDVFA